MRFLYVDVPEEGAATVPLPREAARRLRRVLRLRVGDAVEVVDRARPRRARATLAEGGALEVAAWVDLGPAPEPDLWLCPGLVKADRLEWAAQRAFELGLGGLAPVVTARTQVKPGRRFGERLRKVAEAAGEQSGRVHLPRLLEPRPLLDRLEELASSGRAVWLADPGGAPLPPTLEAPAALVIGPEGGFSPEEVEAAEALGALRVGIGGHVLRAETAAVALTTLALARLGWLGAAGDPPPGG